MALHHTFVNVITGATGSGKTSLIAALLALRPEGERWAVLTNDFGATTLGSGPRAVSDGMEMREVAGCMCCTGQLVLRTALVSLVRETRPCRVLIEASAAAEPAAISALLTAPTFASALDVRAFIATASVRQLKDPRYSRVPVYREQISAADVVVLTGADAVSSEDRAAARSVLAQTVLAGALVIDDLRQVDVSVLDGRPR